jgi:SAM-dependent methyltransferase
MSLVGGLHASLVFKRRIRVLAGHIAPLLPRGATVLDVGCGDGLLGRTIRNARPDVTLTGMDVLVRPVSHIPVQEFDGRTIPMGNRSVDVILLVDVLHHADDPLRLLAEVARVARQAIVIKDHVQAGWLDRQTLRIMDWTGNAAHGVALPYNYWTAKEWTIALQRIGAAIDSWETDLGLYPWPASALFDRGLHFVARVGAGAALRPT